MTVTILSFLEFGFAPTLAAVSILSLLIPLALVALFGRFVGHRQLPVPGTGPWLSRRCS